MLGSHTFYTQRPRLRILPVKDKVTAEKEKEAYSTYMAIAYHCFLAQSSSLNNKARAIYECLTEIEPDRPEPYQMLSYMYLDGTCNMRPDLNRAFEYQKRGSTLKDYCCMFELALSYLYGHGTSENQDEAIRLLRKVAGSNEEGIVGDASFILAHLLLYREPRHVESCLEEDETTKLIVKLLEKAISNKFGPTLHVALLLGQFFRREVANGGSRAMKVYKSVEGKLGAVDIWFEMAKMYESGEGVLMDPLKAILYYEKVIRSATDLELSQIAQQRLESINFRAEESYKASTSGSVNEYCPNERFQK